jgi:GxxExxY protein
MATLVHNDPLTERIIGFAIEVHRHLGPGLLESAYEECLCYELEQAAMVFRRQVPLPIVYKSVRLDCGYRLDVVVENRVIVELKSVERLMPIHEAQVITYLKLSGVATGLLLNFNTPVLKDGVRRLALQI